MSASTLAVTANPAATNSPVLALASRRRNVSVSEKRASSIELVSEGGGVGSGVGSEPLSSEGGRDLSHSIRRDTVLDKPKESKKTGLVNSTISPRRRKVTPKTPSSEKPKWQRWVSVGTKNVLLFAVLLGLVQMIMSLAGKSGSGVGNVSHSDVESRISEVEGFLKTTTKMLQVQLEVVDKKIENEVGGLRRELVKKVDEKGLVLESELKRLEARTDGLDRSLGELKSIEFLTKDDLKRFADELKKSRKSEGSRKDLTLDEIRALAKKIVENEIEKHAADGLGKVDYALASGGAIVVAHSEPFSSLKGSKWFTGAKSRNYVHSDAVKMLQPSFGEPGQCFPLKGSSGFVEIRLRAAIIPEAVTLEHVAKNVAYDRSSAPKDCRISAWFQGCETADPSSQIQEKFLLVEFSYDLERSNAQTFNVESTDVGLVNMVRLDFASNHGSPHTCIYRLRVHGQEPGSVAVSPLQA